MLMLKKISFPVISKEIVFIILCVLIFLLSLAFWLIQKEITLSLEKQLEKQMQIFSLLPVEQFDRELERVKNFADYIGKNRDNFNETVRNIDDAERFFEKKGVRQGILTPDFKVVSGQKFTPEQFSKFELLRTGQSVVDYNANEGLIFAAPVFIDNRTVYIFYTIYDKSILSEKFNLQEYSSYMADNHIVIEDKNGEKIISYPGYNSEVDDFFYDTEIIKQKFETQNSAVIFNNEIDDVFLLGTKLQKTDFIMLGYISWTDVAGEMFIFNFVLPAIFVVLLIALLIIFALSEKTRSAVQQNKSKADFFANVSKNMREPLTEILNSAEIIKREDDNKIFLEHSQKIYNADSKLLSWTKDLKDLSEIESGKFKIAEGKYLTEDLLKNLIRETESLAKLKNLSFNFKVDENLPCEFFGDSAIIKRIISNILSNAVKFTQVGEIYFEIKALGFKRNMKNFIDIQFTVKDSGIGIRKEDKPNLFKNFKRLDAEKNKYVEGIGLGLAMAKAFTEILHGRIYFESNYNEGTTFTVTIPQKVWNNKVIGEFILNNGEM